MRGRRGESLGAAMWAPHTEMRAVGGCEETLRPLGRAGGLREVTARKKLRGVRRNCEAIRSGPGFGGSVVIWVGGGLVLTGCFSGRVAQVERGES